MADKLSPVPFMTWWNSTSISNDFWIEGEQTLIRVHVIPRKTLFNPGRWNTNSPGHKEALLRLLGNLRTTEAVSCKTHREYHPVHGGWRGTEDDAFLPMLWVGRAVFSRARMSSISSFCNSRIPMASRSTPLLTAPTITKQKTLWELTKDELVREAQARGLQFHPKWSPAELRQVIQEDRVQRGGSTTAGAPPPALTKMTLDQLRAAVQAAGLEVPDRPNRASLMRVLRDNGGVGAQTILSFGRYRGYMYQETAPSYRSWAIRETEANPGAQEDLRMFAAWCKLDQEAKETTTTKATLSGYVDAEDTATVPYTPDPFEQWDVVGQHTTPSGARPKATTPIPPRTRRAAPSSASSTTGMDQDQDPEVLDEIQYLEHRLALLRDRQGVPPRHP